MKTEKEVQTLLRSFKSIADRTQTLMNESKALPEFEGYKELYARWRLRIEVLEWVLDYGVVP